MTKSIDKKSKTERHRNWMITSFICTNYDDWRDLTNNSDVRYAIYQMEKCPKTGKDHIQGYIETNKKTSIKQIKNILNDKTVHCEARLGSQNDAIKYCSKIDSRIKDPIEIGTKAEQGRRNDLNAIYEMINNGSSLNDIIDEFPNQYIRYNRGIDKLYENVKSRSIPHFKEVTTSILYGDAGTGKTKLVYERHNDSDVYRLRLTNNGIWFDGYNGQKVLLIDDFYGGIKFHDMLEYMDGYKFQVPIKGGFVYKAWDKVYITSNKHPNEWYNNYKCMEEPAFKRRVTEVIEFKKPSNMTINEPKYLEYIDGCMIEKCAQKNYNTEFKTKKIADGSKRCHGIDSDNDSSVYGDDPNGMIEPNVIERPRRPFKNKSMNGPIWTFTK